MNRYLMVCRLRWPAILLLTGVIALLHQAGIIYWWRSWPLYLILFGVLALVERAVMASQSAVPPSFPNNAGYAPQPGAYAGTPAVPSPAGWTPTTTEIVPAHTDIEFSADEPARKPRKSWEEEGR